MAVVDAALFAALWRHTALLKLQNQIIKGFQQYFATIFCRCSILVTSKLFPQNKAYF